MKRSFAAAMLFAAASATAAANSEKPEERLAGEIAALRCAQSALRQCRRVRAADAPSPLECGTHPLSARRRSGEVRWMLDVCALCSRDCLPNHRRVAYMAAYLLDNYYAACRHYPHRTRVRAYSAACIAICAKFDSHPQPRLVRPLNFDIVPMVSAAADAATAAKPSPPSVDGFRLCHAVSICNGDYTLDELLDIELDVLFAVGFGVRSVTLHDFVEAFAHATDGNVVRSRVASMPDVACRRACELADQLLVDGATERNPGMEAMLGAACVYAATSQQHVALPCAGVVLRATSVPSLEVLNDLLRSVSPAPPSAAAMVVSE